uniref:nucleotidyltransferase family protein n=1 Tax=uncultured Erythrobacter sp. TaxID=263913 RepID=UPI00261A3148|nr:nucleotidyltransferase family protein [uncultured Erythrobacter sp.]
MTHTEAIDIYFADCVRSALTSQPAPDFPPALADKTAELTQRLDFHGIAFLLADNVQTFADWPHDLLEVLQEQARLQAVWEADHSAVIARLVAALHSASFQSTIMKGTALAYSVYSDPATRRRGDTDILIENCDRNQVRNVFNKCGFEPSGDQRALQEVWNCTTPSGFTHQVDLHWAISSSFAISEAIERDHPRARTKHLPRLSRVASCTGAIDAFIQICINRSGHAAFGYNAGSDKLMEGNRLIWAVDLHLLARDFSDQDWADLASIAERWGASRSVALGINFARKTLSFAVPPGIEARLKRPQLSNTISDYYEAGSAHLHFKQDFASAKSMKAKTALVWDHAFPGREFLEQRYPDADGWPISILYARRLLDGAGRILLGRPR